jgi:hypothetical protein
MFLTLAGCAELTRGEPLPEVVDTRADTVSEVIDTSTPFDGDGAIEVEDDAEEVVVPTLSFADDGVHQVLMANCTSSGCHGSGAGGYTLSGSVGADYQATLNTVTVGDGANSRLLKKATNEMSHGGGPIFQTGTPDYELVLVWINGGANP